MVNSESEVLPSIFVPSDESGDAGDVYDENELAEDVDSPLRSKENRVYYDNDSWMDSDHYSGQDAPADPPCNDREWKEVSTRMDEIKVNGSIQRHWKHGKMEIQQIVARCKDVIGRDSLRRQDFVVYYFGDKSAVFKVFEDRLKWNHRHFLRFVITCARLSANQWTVAKLYDEKHPQANMERCMQEEEFLACWRQIAKCGIPNSRDEAANGEVPLWEDVQRALSGMCRNLTVVGRSGVQSYVADDDKFHCETAPGKNTNLAVKIIKHSNDNRWGGVFDVIVCTCTLLLVSLQLHIKGRKQHDNLRNQLYADAFGRCALTPPNLQNIEFHGDRGYFTENSFVSILLLTGCMLTCTCPNGKWLPFVVGKAALAENDKRIVIPEQGIMTLEVREKEFKHEGRTTKLAISAYRTGKGNVVMVASTVYRRLSFDLVAVNETVSKLWNSSDKEALRETGFALDCSRRSGREAKEVHVEFYKIFKELAIVMVTTHQGYREWHLLRMFSITSTSAHALIKGLLRHGMDLEHDYVRKVAEFMCPHYDYDKRVEERERREQAAEGEGEGEEEDGNDEDLDAPEQFNDQFSDDFLLEHGVPDMVDEEDNKELHVRLLILEFKAGTKSLEELTARINTYAMDQLLDSLRRMGMKQDKMPVGEPARRRACLKWANMTPSHRDYAFFSNNELKQIYKKKHAKDAKSSWNTAAKLIAKIIAPVDESEPTQPSNNVKDPNSLQQELMNIALRSISLKPLEGAAKDHCAKGHEMEGIYSEQLLRDPDFPHGTIEEINAVGLVQKVGREYVKDSIDRLVCVTDDAGSGNKKILLTEFKARIKHDVAQREQDRIDELRADLLMEEDHIYAEIETSDPNRFKFIKEEQEMCQGLHHMYTYEQTEFLHAVGNSKGLLSCYLVKADADLLEAYDKTMELINELVYEPFYAATDRRSRLTGSDEFMASVEHAVEVNKERLVDMRTLQVNYQLWSVASQVKNLPMGAMKQVLPSSHSHWNINKPGSDINTQMLWEIMFRAPVHGLHPSLVKRLCTQQEFYMIHRLGQIFRCTKPLDEFRSAAAWRKQIGRGNALWSTVRDIEDDLQGMASLYDPERPLPSPLRVQGGSPIVITNPFGPNFAGRFPNASVQPLCLPVTGSTPQRNINQYYSNPVNAGTLIATRRLTCCGMALVKPIELKTKKRPNTNPVQTYQQPEMARRTCAFCQKEEAHIWCTNCHHYFHDNPNKLPDRVPPLIRIPTGKRNAGGDEIFMYAENNCANAWHQQARLDSIGGIRPGVLPQINLQRFDATAAASSATTGNQADNDTSNGSDGDGEEAGAADAAGG